jgi:hypothetical protein
MVIICMLSTTVIPATGEVHFFIKTYDNTHKTTSIDTDYVDSKNRNHNQDELLDEVPETILDNAPNDNMFSTDVDSGNQSANMSGVNLYLNGPTSIQPSGGNMVTVKLGKLLTSKPNSTEDTSVECPSMWYWVLRGNDPRKYYIVGGFATTILTPIDIESMGVELWATGRAKSVQFLLLFRKGNEEVLKLKTDEKDVSGPTKFVGENKPFKQSLKPNTQFIMFIYYHTPLAQIPPSVELIYGSKDHPAHITTKITNPMNVTFTNLTVSENNVRFNATLKNAFGIYDIANYTLRVRGPQFPRAIRETKDITKTGLNISYDLEFDKSATGSYEIYFVCTDNNQNVWEVKGAKNSAFDLKQTGDYAIYLAIGGLFAIAFILAVWKLHKSTKSKLQTSKKKRMPHKTKG